MDVSALIWLTIAALGLGALAGLRRVPDGTVCTLHRFGRYVRAIGPGLHFTWPVIDQVAHRIALVGHQVEFSGDGRGTAIVYFQILDPERTGAVLEQIDAMVEREARRRLAQLSGGDGSESSLAARLKLELNTQLGALGLRITRCQLPVG
jgi:regulator of protease activity HflC (stomatin/prohibitin superfamily)